MSSNPIQILLCGGGNGIHVCAGYIGAKTGYKVNVLTRNPDQWSDSITVTSRKNGEEEVSEIVGKINKVSSDAKDVAPGTKIYLLGGPGHANPHLLKKIAPYVEKGAFVGTIFGQGGFDWAAMDALGEKRIKDDGITLFALQHIPWICKRVEYGKSARMIGPKKVLYVAAHPTNKVDETAKIMESLFDIPCKSLPNFMCITLTPSNQIIHPARFYGIFEGKFKWDGKTGIDPEKIPTLYDHVDEFSAQCLQEVSDELLELKKAILKKFPKIDLSPVKDLGERIVDMYGDDVKDTSSLQSIFCSNVGYRGCAVPTVPAKEEGKVIPNVESRLFVEDMPYGLCILINIGDLLGVPTPAFKKYLTYHQEFMGIKYLKDGKLNQELIMETGCPARFGIETAEKLLATSM